MLGIDVLPQFKLLKIDVTRDYLDESLVRQAGGRIYSVYLVNVNRQVHVCDLSPSYELHFLEDIPERSPDDEAERERLYDELLEANLETEPVTYSYVRHYRESDFIDGPYAITPEDWQEKLDEANGDPDKAYDLLLEEVLEYVRANSPY